MTFEEFHNGLRVLWNIDAEEFLKAAYGQDTRPADGSPEWKEWLSFQADPHQWFIKAPTAQAMAVYGVITRRQDIKADSVTLSRAQDELNSAGLFDGDAMYAGMLGHSVMDLLRVFVGQGHSGMSAGVAVQLFERLARQEPLTPLTGEDAEWRDTGDGVLQNIRCSHVFKTAGGQAYDSEGRVFREPSGATFTSSQSRVPVTFPYTPKREVVDVPEEDARHG